MKRHLTILILFTVLIWIAAGNAQAGSLDFAVIQPGQPGTESEARPVMAALARYIQQKMGFDETIKGFYFNQLEPALAFLKSTPPAWGIVQLGVYLQHGLRFQMTPVAATMPGGFTKDIWRLVAQKDGIAKWQSLKGAVQGNMLFEKKASACLLFELPPEQLPFTLEGTFRPLRSLRSVTKGKLAGVVLDRVQYETVKTMPSGEKIQVLQTSRELPASPVIWFGAPDGTTKNLAGVLQAMKNDANAAKLLTLLQTDGFGPSDPELATFRLGENNDTCFMP